MKQKLICSLLVLFSVAFLQAQDVTFTINKQVWLMPDISSFKFNEQDTVKWGQNIFIKKQSIHKFIPAGYRIPALSDLKFLLAAIEGANNSTGGKTVDSAYLQKLLPFKLNGIYFERLKSARGIAYMTSFYTSADTLWQFDTSSLKPAQVALHIYRNGNASMNIEPTYQNLANGQMFCNLLLIRKEEI